MHVPMAWIPCRSSCAIITMAAASLLAGCRASIGDTLAISEIAPHGFVRYRSLAEDLSGRELSLSGYVDHRNLYGGPSTAPILREWWGGDEARPDSWRFNLKAEPDAAVGASFPVHVPNDAGRDLVLKRFVADAREGRPTAVLVRGTLKRFDAPSGLFYRAGLTLTLHSSADIHVLR